MDDTPDLPALAKASLLVVGEGVLLGCISRSKKPAGRPLARVSREWADGFAACKRAAAVEDTPTRRTGDEVRDTEE